MRTSLGILLLIGGLLWAAPGVWLLRECLRGPQVTQVGPNEFQIYHSHYFSFSVSGRPVSVATACAISLVPGAAISAFGLYVLFTNGRHHTPRSSDRVAD
jgi:hypothetical protein